MSSFSFCSTTHTHTVVEVDKMITMQGDEVRLVHCYKKPGEHGSIRKLDLCAPSQERVGGLRSDSDFRSFKICERQY